MLCGSCATLVQPGAFFCAICGAPVREAPTRGTIGERRQITAMFCDLVESTRLAQRLDPEDLHQVILRFQALGTESVERLGGRVAQYLGDGLLVYFGQPRAHEDDAARALRAALAILEAMPRLNAELAALLVEPLSVRVGIHTGLVVVGRVGVRDHPETLALGDTVNIASRLQAVAEPDQVVLSSATQRLVGREFVLAELGKKTLRGVAEPVSVYRLIGLRDTTPAAFAPTPHVGRDREMERLVAGLEQARGGQGAVVLVQGEAGIGKSRLVRSFREEATAHGTAWLEWRCSRYHQATAFHPVLVAFKQALGFAEDETPAAHLARL